MRAWLLRRVDGLPFEGRLFAIYFEEREAQHKRRMLGGLVGGYEVVEVEVEWKAVEE